MRLRSIILLTIVAFATSTIAQEERREISVAFRVNRVEIDTAMDGNAERLAELSRLLSATCGTERDTLLTLTGITFTGFASPEGRPKWNAYLAAARRDALVRYVRSRFDIPDTLISIPDSTYIDWARLTAMVEADTAMPGRATTLDVLYHEPEFTYDRRGALVRSRKDCLMRLRGGKAWWYMHEHFYPQLRGAGAVIVTFRRRPAAPAPPPADTLYNIVAAPAVADTAVAVADTVRRKPVYWSLHTNALYDLLLLPNVGGELYVGRSWSVEGNWIYGWWRRERSHHYWRAYGGHIAVRRWFGKAAEEKPLTGHHVGLYGQVLTYDAELGGKGYMGGQPGGNIFDEASWGAGVEYGFALPLTRRLNVDFTLGVGYFGGTYYEYRPIDTHYVWLATKERHWIGPTRVEASLVYLLGRDNVNARKGGGR